ncbi:MAG: sensor domain-containing diguanylate cyclase [Aeromicrobium sp.]
MTIDDAAAPTDTYVRGMERLVDAVQELSLARELEQVQHIVRSTARELVGSDGATFVLRDDGQCYYADEDAIEPLWKGSRFPMSACISGWAMLNKQPAVIEDIYADDRIPHAAYRPTFVKSLAMVPIRSLDPIGAIGNYWADDHLATPDEIRLLQALADATSIAMENVAVYAELERRVLDRTAALEQANREIHALSVTDPLTGLLNRRGFFDEAERRLEAARIAGHDCLVAYIDIDGLKTVNDQLGHRAGDQMIIAVSHALQSVIRSDDLLARLGGDEFCALITPSPHDEGVIVDRLTRRFDDLNQADDRAFMLGASVGVTRITELPAALIDELVRSSDERMYVEKRSRSAQR